MKLLGTRIRVEESEHFTRYFPEFEVEEKGLFRTRRCWNAVCDLSPFKFGRAYMVASCLFDDDELHSKGFAEEVLKLQCQYYDKEVKEMTHEVTKKEYYI
ncbi:hypothetical protein D3C85_681700 [compost metagenome]